MPSVNLLEAMPSLTAQLDPRIVPVVRDRARVTVVAVERGPWSPPSLRSEDLGHLGLVVLEGWVWQSMRVAEQEGGDLLGAGDVIRPWLEPEAGGVVLGGASAWTALTPLRLAVLDSDFARRVGPWPQVARVVSDALVIHGSWQVFLGGLRHVPSVARRVELLLWGLADRWGRATPEGVVVPVPVLHAHIATLVGARRTSVSSAVAALTRAGAVGRRNDGFWTLAYPGSGPPDGSRLAEPPA